MQTLVLIPLKQSVRLTMTERNPIGKRMYHHMTVCTPDWDQMVPNLADEITALPGVERASVRDYLAEKNPQVNITLAEYSWFSQESLAALARLAAVLAELFSRHGIAADVWYADYDGSTDDYIFSRCLAEAATTAAPAQA